MTDKGQDTGCKKSFFGFRSKHTLPSKQESMSMNFEIYASKGNELVNHLASDLGVPRDQAARILRAVLHALRNRITLDENFDLLSQLPMVLKAVYVDGWKPAKTVNQSSHLKDFLEEIRYADAQLAAYDFGNDAKAKSMVLGVFRVLAQFVSAGELNVVVAGLPLEIKNFIKSIIDENQLF